MKVHGCHLLLRALHGGDDDGARGVVLDHQDAGAGGDVVVAVGGVGVERLGAAADGDHHLAEAAVARSGR